MFGEEEIEIGLPMPSPHIRAKVSGMSLSKDALEGRRVERIGIDRQREQS